MISQNDLLEQKQKYLRENIDQSQYQDFYEYCQSEIGSVDVAAWSLSFIKKLITAFKEYKERIRNEEGDDQHERTYNNYQSVGVEQKIQAKKDFEDCKSSKIDKSSAVDLLDEAFQNSSVSSKYPSSLSRKNQIQRTNSLSFKEFDLWTNGQVPAKNSKSQIRNKSYTNFELPQKKAAHTPKYEPKYCQKRNSQQVSTTQKHNMALQLFMPQPVPGKKQSPYLKKQAPEPFEAKKDKSIKQNSVDPFLFGFQEVPKQKNKEIKENSKSQEKSDKNNEADENKKNKWLLEQKLLNEEITCFKSAQRSQLDHPNLNIFIDDKYQIVHRNFLAPDYPMYMMKVVPLGLECKRNYDDFAKLKKTLQKFFPAIHLAYLDDSSWLNGTDSEFILKQKKMLEFFMRDLLRNKQIRNSRFMEDFLTLQNHKSMKRKSEKYEKMEQLKGIEELCLLSGKVNVFLSNEQTHYINSLHQLLHRMDDYFSRHRKLTETITKQYSNLMETYNSMIKLMNTIQKQIKNFNNRVTTNQLKHLGKVYKTLKQTYKNDLSVLKFDYEISEKKLSPFLKYEHENMLELKKIFETEKKMRKNFEKRKITEKLEQGQSYLSDAARHGKKGILQESKNIIVFKYQLGYIDNQCRKQGNRVLDEMGYKFIDRWQSLSELYIEKHKKSMEYRQNMKKIDKSSYLP